jgi:hypothetical protein
VADSYLGHYGVFFYFFGFVGILVLHMTLSHKHATNWYLVGDEIKIHFTLVAARFFVHSAHPLQAQKLMGGFNLPSSPPPNHTCKVNKA